MRTSPVTALRVTAVTNFVWACEVFLLAGLLLGDAPSARSAAAAWGAALLLMGIGALLGGIDHGFLEPHGDSRLRVLVQRLMWVSVGVLTFFALLTIGLQFASPGTFRILLIAGIVQLAVFTVLVVFVNHFLVVIVNYAPVMILFLVLNVVGLRAGTGSPAMVAGLGLSFVASAVQAIGVDVFHPVDRDGLYHIVLMLSSVFLFLGGRNLSG